MLCLGFAISHGGAASLCATLRGDVASLCATLRGGAASLCATLRGGGASLCATLRWGAASLCTTLRGGAASLCATWRRGAVSLGTALSLGRRGTIPSASHDGGAVPLSGAVPSSVSCGSARVLALYARGAEVVVVMGVAVGAVTGVARSAAWGSWGHSYGVVSSLVPLSKS